MTLQQRLEALATAIGLDIKSLDTRLDTVANMVRVARVAARALVDTTNPPGTVDDVSLTPGDRVLLTNQQAGLAGAKNNGIWEYNGAGVAMTRAPDFNDSAEIVKGQIVVVTNGAMYGGATFIITSVSNPIINTDSITFAYRGLPPTLAGQPSNTPVNNEEIIYRPSAGVMWHLKYDSAVSIDAHKWVVIGGTPLTANDDALQGSLAQAVAWTTADVPGTPVIAVPTPGRYDVEATMQFANSGSASHDLYISRADTNANLVQGRAYAMPGGDVYQQVPILGVGINLDAPTSVKLRAASSVTAANAYKTQSRNMRVTPKRVSLSLSAQAR